MDVIYLQYLKLQILFQNIHSFAFEIDLTAIVQLLISKCLEI